MHCRRKTNIMQLDLCERCWKTPEIRQARIAQQNIVVDEQVRPAVVVGPDWPTIPPGRKDWLLPAILEVKGGFNWSIRKADRWIRDNYELVRGVYWENDQLVVEYQKEKKYYKRVFDNTPAKKESKQMRTKRLSIENHGRTNSQ